MTFWETYSDIADENQLAAKSDRRAEPIRPLWTESERAIMAPVCNEQREQYRLAANMQRMEDA